MSTMQLEHLNLTVSDPKRTAATLATLFDWHVRWEGPSLNDGYTVHVGSEHRYLALYAPSGDTHTLPADYTRAGALNHIGVLVEDLDEIERRVIAAGLKTYHHQEYEPGRRFYFRDGDGIEYEVVSYARR